MPRERITRRQKNISRLLMERRERYKSKLKALKKGRYGMRKIAMWLLAATLIALPAMNEAGAATAKEINTDVDAALKLFYAVKGAKSIIKKSAGVLVFPKVLKVGIGIGGEYGEGALRIRGRTVDYYSTFAASIGLQLGAQQKTIIMAFMDKAALKKFREASGWKVGVDASVVVIVVGAGGAIDTATANEPIVAFVFDQKGLMYNLTLEGSKITKIKL